MKSIDEIKKEIEGINPSDRRKILESYLKEYEDKNFYLEMKDGWTEEDFRKSRDYYDITVSIKRLIEKDALKEGNPEEFVSKYSGLMELLETIQRNIDTVKNELDSNVLIRKDYICKKLNISEKVLIAVLDMCKENKERGRII